MSAQPPILIAGGGIGGLATALALAKVGYAVEIFERHAIVANAGAGIQLGPNAVKVLQQLGVADALAPHAAAPSSLAIYSGSGRAPIAQMPLGATIEARCGAPYWTVHRADLHRALAAAVSATPAIALTHGRAIATATSDGSSSVTVSFADGTRVTGAALIGADGLWSPTRRLVAPAYTPTPSGFCAYRSVIVANAVSELDTGVVGAWLSPHTHIVHYPVKAGRAVNVVVVVRNGDTASDWTAPADRADVLAATEAVPDALRMALAAAPQWHKWALPQPIDLGAWHQGNIALVGDAAHAMLPFFAQGGAMALEDATALAAALAATRHDNSKALADYETSRRARVKRVQDASVENGRIFHLSGFMATGRDAVMRLTPGRALLSMFDWLYAYDGPQITV